MDRAAVTRRVWELSEPLARAAGLELVDVQYRPEGGRLILRLLLDRSEDRLLPLPQGEGDVEARPRPGRPGVTLEELARVSRELGDVLDAHDAVTGRYHLECSSPGLNRPLVRPEHFRRAVGKRVDVRTHEPHAGRRQFHGVLEAVADDAITVHDPDAGVVSFALDSIERASIQFDFPRPARPPHAHA